MLSLSIFLHLQYVFNPNGARGTDLVHTFFIWQRFFVIQGGAKSIPQTKATFIMSTNLWLTSNIVSHCRLVFENSQRNFFAFFKTVLYYCSNAVLRQVLVNFQIGSKDQNNPSQYQELLQKLNGKLKPIEFEYWINDTINSYFDNRYF